MELVLTGVQQLHQKLERVDQQWPGSREQLSRPPRTSPVRARGLSMAMGAPAKGEREASDGSAHPLRLRRHHQGLFPAAAAATTQRG